MRAEPSSMASMTAERDDPAAIPLDYVPIPAGTERFGTDRARSAPTPAGGGSSVDSGLARYGWTRVRATVRPWTGSKPRRCGGLRRLGRHARARHRAHVIAAAGLPFLVAALLGLVSVAIRNVPGRGGDRCRLPGQRRRFPGRAAAGCCYLPTAVRMADPPRTQTDCGASVGARRGGRAAGGRPPGARGTRGRSWLPPLGCWRTLGA